MLVFALIITLIPVQEASSSEPITLTTESFSNATTEEDAVDVYTPTINISGIVTGANPADVRYTLKEISTGIQGGGDIAPTTSGNQFTFQNVQLFTGLNEITLRVTGVESRFYVHYISTPTISGLEILDPSEGYKLFKQYPQGTIGSMQDPFQLLGTSAQVKDLFDKVMKTSANNLNIRGQVNNVSRIFINGEEILSTPTTVFTHNLAQNGIYKGDHTINITGENSDGSSFTFPFTFGVYNDQPTFLNVATKEGATTKFLDASKDTIVNLNGNSIEFGGDLYVPSGVDEGTLEDIEFIVTKNGTQFGTPHRLDYEDTLIIKVNPDVTVEESSQGNYKVYRIQTDLTDIGIPTIDSIDSYKLEVRINHNSGTYRSQSFNIKYIDPNQPFILDVINFSTGVSLLSNPIIMSSSESLRVFVNDVTNSLSVTGGGITAGDISAIQGSAGNRYFNVDLTNIERGNHDITFTAINGGDSNNLVVPVNVTLTPTVKVTNIANNQVFTDPPSKDVGVEYVNLPNPSDRALTKVLLNGDAISSNAITAAGAPVLEQDKFNIDLAHNDVILREGQNTLEIVITSETGGQTTTTVVTIKFLYLPVNTPQIGIFEPRHLTESSNTDAFQVIPGQVGSYVTTEQHARLRFTLTNNIAEVIYLQKNGENFLRFVEDNGSWLVAAPDALSTENNLSSYVDISTSSGVTTFEIEVPETSNPLPDDFVKIGGHLSLLNKDNQGNTEFNTTTTFTVNAYANFDGVVATPPQGTRTMVIQRQTAKFIFTPGSEADIVMNIDKGIINKNFFPFDILTEAADNIVVNKMEAKNVAVPSSVDNEEGRQRFVADIPLKVGQNKITVIITRGEQTITDTIQVFYSDAIITGAGFRQTLGKNTRFRVFDRNLELRFPKGTILTATAIEEQKHFSKLLNEIPIMFGMADPNIGIISEAEKNDTAGKQRLSGLIESPSNFDFVGSIYWIDAGTVDNPGGLVPLDTKTNSNNFSESFMDRALTLNSKYNLKPSQRGELTIFFDEEIRNEMHRRISVWHHNGSEWRNVGGVLDSKKNSLTVTFDEFGYYAVMRQRESYRDIVEHPWAKEELELLSSREWMKPNGFGGNFGAYDTANRGELATMLVKIFDIPLDYEGRSSFDDVPSGFRTPRYEHKYIETAARVGIVQGKSIRFFDPEGTLTREQAAVMIARAANYRLQDYDRAKQRVDKLFVDGEQINRYAVPSVQAVAQAGLIEGIPVINVGGDAGGRNRDEFRFNPNGVLTRDQLAVITVRLLENQKLL